jgi:hypothetical protein
MFLLHSNDKFLENIEKDPFLLEVNNYQFLFFSPHYHKIFLHHKIIPFLFYHGFEFRFFIF